MAIFAHGKLAEYQEYYDYDTSHYSKKDIETLVKKAVNASDGVFLWVSPSIRSLLEGITNGDTIDDLFARLQEIPQDLDELYRHMWERIPQRYLKQAARLILMIQTRSDYFSSEIPPLLVYFGNVVKSWAVLKLPFAARSSPSRRKTRYSPWKALQNVHSSVVAWDC